MGTAIIAAVTSVLSGIFSLVSGNKQVKAKEKEIDAAVSMNYADNAKSIVSSVSNSSLVILVFIVIAGIFIFYINKTKK